MFNLSHVPGRTANANGREYLFFSGYSYLGMNHVPEFVDLVKQGIDKYGWLFPSSRISNTQFDLFSAFEAKLSEITGTEDTVCFSSGFLAGRVVTEVLKHRSDHFLCAPQTHPAICVAKSDYKDHEEWKKAIQPCIDHAVLFFDSVNPLTAEVNDTSFLNDVPENITAVIDDSHGAGLLNHGKGISGNLVKKETIDYIITYSLSKAFNLVGGAVSCTREMAAQLKASPFYTASTSISPAFAYAFLNGQDIYHSQREKLRNNIDLFNHLTNGRLISHPELPVFILQETVDEEKLQKAGIIISAFAYPDPEGKRINRVVLNALHTEADLQKLAKALA